MREMIDKVEQEKEEIDSNNGRGRKRQRCRRADGYGGWRDKKTYKMSCRSTLCQGCSLSLFCKGHGLIHRHILAELIKKVHCLCACMCVCVCLHSLANGSIASHQDNLLTLLHHYESHKLPEWCWSASHPPLFPPLSVTLSSPAVHL